MTWKTDNEELKEELESDLEMEESLEEETNEENNSWNDEVSALKELLARNQADYQNFKMRVERDREDMIHFLKVDIFKKILPRLDDLRRIIKNTPEEQKWTSIYEWVLILEKTLTSDLDKLWVKHFDSIWQEVNPDLHEVMTQIPSETPWVIVDEFEKWYMIWDRVLRIAKVIVWS